MSKTCTLVRTPADRSLLGTIGYKSSLEAGLRCITTINEKGPYRTFRYGSTQAAKMPRIGPNLQIWTFAPQNDGMLGQIGLICCYLYRTSSATCLAEVLGSQQLVWFVIVVCCRM
jgi:hypothetical protein